MDLIKPPPAWFLFLVEKPEVTCQLTNPANGRVPEAGAVGICPIVWNNRSHSLQFTFPLPNLNMPEAIASRMLVVDDEPDMTRGLRRILKLRGYEVRIANSGEEAIEIGRGWTPDGILMDMKMSGISGVEAYRSLRPNCPQAFVIFMTAHSDLEDEARREGAVDVLSKPLDVQGILAAIEAALQNRNCQ